MRITRRIYQFISNIIIIETLGLISIPEDVIKMLAYAHKCMARVYAARTASINIFCFDNQRKQQRSFYLSVITQQGIEHTNNK